MKLNVHDRFILVQILSEVKDDWVTWGMVTKVIANLSLTDKEFKEFEIKQVEGQIDWNKKGLEEREIEIGEKVTSIVFDKLTILNETKPRGLLEQKHLNLYKKFVVDKKGT